jgi:disulfide bond formation protein DsbB
MNKNFSLKYFLKKDFYNFAFASLFFICVLALALAFIAQYIFGYEPCILCLYQRIPFYAVIFLSLVYFFVKKTCTKISERFKKNIFFLCILTLIFNAGLAFYHSAVELKIIKAFSGCATENIAKVNDLEQLREILKNAKVKKCDEPELMIFNLSMANWNFIFCLVLVIFYSRLFYPRFFKINFSK